MNFLRSARIPGELVFHASGRTRRRSERHREVALSGLPVVELAGEDGVGVGIFRGDDDTGGILIQAVDDARAGIPGREPLRDSPAVKEERVEESAAGVPAPRVHNHALALVDDDHVVILEQHVQGQVLGDEVGRRCVDVAQGHHVTVPHLSGQPGRHAVYGSAQDAPASLAS